MAKNRSILEVQETELTWSVITGTRQRPRILEVFRKRIESTDEAGATGAAIHEALDTLQEDPGPVHVALGDRGSQHFTLSVPKAMSRSDGAFCEISSPSR